MIRPMCVVCDTELEEAGALLLSPPGATSMVKKEHICRTCYMEVKKVMKRVATAAKLLRQHNERMS